MKRLTRRHYLAALFLISLALRVGATLSLRDISQGPGLQMGADGIEFNQLALNVARGLGYALSAGAPTSFRAPGFPLVLAAVFATFGECYEAAYLLLSILGAVACVLVFLVAESVLSQRDARIAGALTAVYFPHVYFSTVFCSETVLVVTFTAGLWAFLLHLRHGSLVAVGAAGVALGWSTLTRPFAMLLLPLWLGLLLWSRRQEMTRGVLGAAVLAIGFAAVVAPWTFRNYLVHGKVVAVSTNGGSTFYGSNNDVVLREWRHFGGWVSTLQLPGRNLIDATPNEVAHDQMEWALGKAWVRSHIASVPLLLVGKFGRLWMPDLDSGNKKYVVLQTLLYTPFLFLFVIGIAQCVTHRHMWTLSWLTIHSTILATVLTALVFWGAPRFRDANLAALMAYAALGLNTIAGRGQRGDSSGKDA